MRAKEILTELFDTVIPFSWTKSTKQDAVAKFKIGEIGYWVFFNSHSNGEKWDVSFQAEIKNPITKQAQRFYDATGTGKQYLVFTTVIRTIEAFLKEYKPLTLIWHADKGEDTRVELYSALLNRFKTKLNQIGYDVSSGDSILRDYSEYVIKRIDSPS
jgi:hypothetical protein